MEVDSLIYQPVMPTFDEAEEVEFEAIESEILKKALKSSRQILPVESTKDILGQTERLKQIKHEQARESEVDNASLEQTLAKVEADAIKLSRFIAELENRKDSVERSINNFEALLGEGFESGDGNPDHRL